MELEAWERGTHCESSSTGCTGLIFSRMLGEDDISRLLLFYLFSRIVALDLFWVLNSSVILIKAITSLPRNKSTYDFIKLGMLSSTDGSNIKQLNTWILPYTFFQKCNIPLYLNVRIFVQYRDKIKPVSPKPGNFFIYLKLLLTSSRWMIDFTTIFTPFSLDKTLLDNILVPMVKIE